MKLSISLQREIAFQLKTLISKGAGPGFQLVLGFKDQCLGIFCEGIEDFHSRRPVRPETYFDLASLTKIIVTVDLIIEALQTHRLASLDICLKNFFPFFVSELKNKTIRDLLNHQAGLKPIFEELWEGDGAGRDEKIKFFLRKIDENYDEVSLSQVYSDIDFQILGVILESLYGDSLKNLVRTPGLSFGPLKFPFQSFLWRLGSPTIAQIQSLDSPPQWLSGQSQDPRARWWDGVSGHAGLFGSARSIEAWGQELFRSYHGKGLRLGDKAVRTVISFSERRGHFLNGFDTPSGESQAGSRFGPSTIGHLGYTGTSFWMDIEKGWRVTLLTHRFQPGLDPNSLRQMRPEFHNWIVDRVFSTL